MRPNRLGKLKKTMCIALSVSLASVTLSLPRVAFGSEHTSKAEEYVVASHRRAKAVAQGFIREKALEAVRQLIVRMGLTPDPSMILGERLREIERLKANLAVSDADLASETFNMADDIQAIADDFSKSLTAAEKARLQALDAVLEARLAAKMATETLESIEGQLSRLCQTGVAIDLDSPMVPSLQPFVPPLVFEARVATDFSGKPVGTPQFSGSSTGDDQSGMMTSLAVAGATAAVFSLITNGTILSENAMAAAAAKLSTAQMAAGFGIVAAIVVAYVLIDYSIQMKKASAEADDIRDATNTIIFKRATAEDVRRYSIEACRETLAPVQTARTWIRRIQSANEVPAEFIEAEKRALESFTGLLTAQRKFIAARQSIDARYVERAQTPENQAAWMKEFQALSEYKELTRLTSRVTPEMAGQLMQVAITRLVVDAEKRLTSLPKESREAVAAADLTVYRKRLYGLRKAAYIARESAFARKNTTASEAVLKVELGKVYRDFDSLMVKVVSALFSESSRDSWDDRGLSDEVSRLIRGIESLAEKWPEEPAVAHLRKLFSSIKSLLE